MYLNENKDLKMLEKEFQELIENNDSIKRYIIESLELEDDTYTFDRETEYINGITSDFTIIKNNKIRAILECKRADIGVTEYVRGVGQLFQYDYFKNNHIKPKRFSGYEYEDKYHFYNALVIPSTFIKNTTINIGRFAYPKSSAILEVNMHNDYVRRITTSELEALANAEKSNLYILSQYYIRDNRIFEIYMLLVYLRNLGNVNQTVILNRREIEEKLRKTETINNGNWRNAFISISTLGFINNKNRLTETGLLMSAKNYEEFLALMYKSYLKPFIDELMDVFNGIDGDYIDMNNQKIKEVIELKHSKKEVLFLTESNGRYISSWMNILRDDYGCIEFEPRNSSRKVIYFPDELTDVALIRRIRTNTKGFEYIDKLEKLIIDGEI